MSRKTAQGLASTTVMAVAIASLAACGGATDDGATTDGGKTTLTFAYIGTTEQQESWNELFAEFESENPDIDLEAQAVAVNNWAEFFNKISTQIAGGQVPDIIQVATEGQRMFASKGLLAPLDDYIAADQDVIDEYYADIDPNLIEWNAQYSSPDGKTYYLPGDFNTMAMWCNTELFDQAGVTLPARGEDWSWDEFEAAAQAVKETTDAYAYAADTGYFIGVMPWVLTNGGSSFSEDWSTPTFDTPEVVEAATFVRSLVEQELASAPGGTFDQYTAFAQDKLACFGGGRWPVINIRNLDAIEKTQIVSWPVNSGNGSPVGWNGYPIMKESENKDAAWTFIKFLISEGGSSFYAELGGQAGPARRSVAESESYLANSPVGTEILYDALTYATPIPSPDRGAEVQIVIEDAWQQILVGNTSPEEGAAAAQAALVPLLAE